MITYPTPPIPVRRFKARHCASFLLGALALVGAVACEQPDVTNAGPDVGGHSLTDAAVASSEPGYVDSSAICENGSCAVASSRDAGDNAWFGCPARAPVNQTKCAAFLRCTYSEYHCHCTERSRWQCHPVPEFGSPAITTSGGFDAGRPSKPEPPLTGDTRDDAGAPLADAQAGDAATARDDEGAADGGGFPDASSAQGPCDGSAPAAPVGLKGEADASWSDHVDGAASLINPHQVQ